MSDANRLRWVMTHIDAVAGLKLDRYDYATLVAKDHGREDPTPDDELNGFRQMIDAAMGLEP